MGKTVERFELDTLPTKPPGSQNDAILPENISPPQMVSTEWETPLTENNKSSDNTEIFQSVPTLTSEFDLNPHDFSHSNGNRKTNQPSTYPSPPQVGNNNPSTEN